MTPSKANNGPAKSRCLEPEMTDRVDQTQKENQTIKGVPDIA
jgi:hypothetical protein